MHFPFIGYYDVYNYECSAAYGVIGGQPKCIETSLKSPFDWVSKGALLHWFGDMTNFLCTVIFIFVAGLLCLVFFKSTPGDLKKDEEDVMSDHSDR